MVVLVVVFVVVVYGGGGGCGGVWWCGVGCSRAMPLNTGSEEGGDQYRISDRVIGNIRGS